MNISDVIRHAHQDKPESVKVAIENILKRKITKHYKKLTEAKAVDFNPEHTTNNLNLYRVTVDFSGAYTNVEGKYHSNMYYDSTPEGAVQQAVSVFDGKVGRKTGTEDGSLVYSATIKTPEGVKVKVEVQVTEVAKVGE